MECITEENKKYRLRDALRNNGWSITAKFAECKIDSGLVLVNGMIVDSKCFVSDSDTISLKLDYSLKYPLNRDEIKNLSNELREQGVIAAKVKKINEKVIRDQEVINSGESYKSISYVLSRNGFGSIHHTARMVKCGVISINGIRIDDPEYPFLKEDSINLNLFENSALKDFELVSMEKEHAEMYRKFLARKHQLKRNGIYDKLDFSKIIENIEKKEGASISEDVSCQKQYLGLKG